ncbi:MAG: hypothetical protein RKO66_05350 [Candidatus Contendobacter sp.]|nr:hypothetical protein [Candidatus Contendobacter sp.]
MSEQPRTAIRGTRQMNGPSDFHDWEYEQLSARDEDNDNDEGDVIDDHDYTDYDFPPNYPGKPL